MLNSLVIKFANTYSENKAFMNNSESTVFTTQRTSGPVSLT